MTFLCACEVVLLQKISSDVSLRMFKEFLTSLCTGLRVELTSLSVVKNCWVKVKVSGDDEKVAVRFLGKEAGIAPVTYENVRRFSVIRGKVISSHSNLDKVCVDVGVFSPETVNAVVSLQRLQGQLVDGGKVTLERIAESFGLFEGFPLDVRVLKRGKKEFEVELTENQLELYGRWIGSRVDRLVILGALSKTVRTAVRRAGLERDIVKVESLGIMDHAVVCKLGTDAAGLVPKLGRQLFEATLLCFSPRRVLELVKERW
jgi:hypothetical protein